MIASCSKKALSPRLILQTNFGGVPYLNDFLLSLFDVKVFNIKYQDILNNIKIFDLYAQNVKLKSLNDDNNDRNVKKNGTSLGGDEKAAVKVLNEYFNLETTYLTNFCVEDLLVKDMGCGEANTYFINCNNGKLKITNESFCENYKILNPDLCVIPFEYLPVDVGKNRRKRANQKVKDFLEYFTKQREDEVLKAGNFASKTLNRLIIPLFLNNIDQISKEENNNSLFEIVQELSLHGERYNQQIFGYLLFLCSYKEFNYSSIQTCKKLIESHNLKKKKLFLFGEGNPIDLLVGAILGIEYFETSYPFKIAEKGHAISSQILNEKINFNDKAESEKFFKETQNFSSFELKTINLSDEVFIADTSILEVGCRCFTCSQNYTKAYIHHLLKCNELNATILLILHNLHFEEYLLKFYNHLQEEEKFIFLHKFLKQSCV